MIKLSLWLPGVGAAAVLATASTLLAVGWTSDDHGASAQAPATSGPVSTAAAQQPAATPSATRSSSAPGSPSTAGATSSTGAAAPTGGAFWLTVRTGRGDILAAVAPLRATQHADGTADPIDPPHSTAQQWNTAAWIEQSSYPSAPARGPSYIYGHACHYHVCPFSRLTDAAVGNAITVQSTGKALTYRICGRGLSSKSTDLVVPGCGGSSVDLVLVTCQYEHGDTSTANLVVAATLVPGND